VCWAAPPPTVQCTGHNRPPNRGSFRYLCGALKRRGSCSIRITSNARDYLAVEIPIDLSIAAITSRYAFIIAQLIRIQSTPTPPEMDEVMSDPAQPFAGSSQEQDNSQKTASWNTKKFREEYEAARARLADQKFDISKCDHEPVA